MQDRKEMLAEGERTLDLSVRDRVSFKEADFFAPQPTKNAGVYLLRQCTHNWADEDVIRIFKAIVPGLEFSSPTTPLLINDIVLPVAGITSRLKEREMRETDMAMLVSFGARQRTKADFEFLLKEADPRYEIRKVKDTGALGLLEVYLNHDN